MAVYTIEQDKVLIQKNGFDTITGYAIGAGVMAFVVYFLMEAIPLEYRQLICLGLLLGFPIAYYLLKQIQIIFDSRNEIVFIHYPLLGQRELIRFAEIHTVDFISESSMYSGFKPYGGYYRIARKSDPVGKGIKILSNVAQEKSEAVDFYQNALPILLQYINGVQQTQAHIKNPLEKKQYVKEKEPGIFVFRHIRWLSILFWCFLLCIGIMFGSDYLKNGIHEWVEAAILIVFVVLPLFMLLFRTKSTTIDKINNTITVQCWGGLLKKQRPLNTFSGFQYQRNTHNGIYTGTDLNMNFVNSHPLAITDFYSTKKLHKAMSELNDILL